MRRLESKLRGMWQTRWNPEKPLYGTVTRSGFAVQITPALPRTFNPYFIHGEFAPSAVGTTIRARYGVQTTTRLFVAGMAAFSLLMWWRILRPFSNSLFPDLFMYLGPLIVIALFGYWVGRDLARMVEPDRELILRAIAEITEARISEAPDAASAPRS